MRPWLAGMAVLGAIAILLATLSGGLTTAQRQGTTEISEPTKTAEVAAAMATPSPAPAPQPRKAVEEPPVTVAASVVPAVLHLNLSECSKGDLQVECPEGATTCRVILADCATVSTPMQ